jgi:parallel beta-helix repeat protein
MTMNKKTFIATTTIITALLISIVAGVQVVEITKGNFIPTPQLTRILITKDGNIEPSTAPIEKLGNTYLVLSNINNYSIQILCDNIILDGQGFLLQSQTTGDLPLAGIFLENTINVTVQNIRIKAYQEGIRNYYSSNNKIVENKISDCTFGISMVYSDNIIIEKNTITNSNAGIFFSASSQITIRENNITKNGSGINLYMNPGFTDHINITRNNINYNSGTGIEIQGSSKDIVTENNITNNQVGVSFYTANSCTFYYNNFISNFEQFQIGYRNDSSTIPDIIWDNGKEGNYWSNYTGFDLNFDGIGDTPHIVDKPRLVTYLNNRTYIVGIDAQDKYPLIKPHILIDNNQPSASPTLAPTSSTSTNSVQTPSPTIAEPTATSNKQPTTSPTLTPTLSTTSNTSPTLTPAPSPSSTPNISPSESPTQQPTLEPSQFATSTPFRDGLSAPNTLPLTIGIATIAIVAVAGILAYFKKIKK